MPNILQLFPEIDGEEQLFPSGLVSDMTDPQAQIFSISYRAQRKSPMTFLLWTLVGFVILAGIGRFYNGHIGMGILYLLTGGLCYIGTLVDVFRFKKIVLQGNMMKAQQLAIMAKASG
jgi:hypothetical protein